MEEPNLKILADIFIVQFFKIFFFFHQVTV